MNRKTLLVAAGGLVVAGAAFALAWFTRDRSVELGGPDGDWAMDGDPCGDPNCCGGLVHPENHHGKGWDLQPGRTLADGE
jgi:hypothetical protein